MSRHDSQPGWEWWREERPDPLEDLIQPAREQVRRLRAQIPVEIPDNIVLGAE